MRKSEMCMQRSDKKKPLRSSMNSALAFKQWLRKDQVPPLTSLVLPDTGP